MPVVFWSILRWLGISALIGIGIPLIEKGITIATFLAIVGAIQSLAGNLIDWGIALQGILLNPAAIPVVQTIWTTFRDFTNIFFILILLIIAFATIFNIKDYKASDLLPKLLIAALLINFSLVIAVWVIELLYVPAQVFLNPLAQGSTVSEKLADALRIQELFSPLLNEVLVIPKFLTEAGLKLALFVIKAFLTAWVALIIWARIIILLGLIIVSPIAWLGYAFPHIRERSWEAWWKELLSWGSITIVLFGLIYFVILFSQRISAQFLQAAPGFGGIVVPSLGLAAQQFILGLITVGLFIGGLMYIRSMSGSLYDWTKLGFMKLWGWSGAGVKWGTKALGVTGAARQIRERMAEEGPILGARAREAREARIAERLAGIAGLAPTYAAQRTLLDQSEKASKNIDDRFKQAKSTTEERAIIDELRTKVVGGAKDPGTLAAINALAKKGQLDVALFNQAAENFKDMPLALTKVFSEWKEGKFGGIKADELIPILRDIRTPLEAKRMGYNFIASDDGKRVIQDKSFDSAAFKEMYEVLGGRNTKDGRNAKKFIGEINPVIVGEYNFNSPTTEFDDPADYPTDIADAILKQIKKTGSKDFTKYGKEIWDNPDFKSALGDLLYDKATKDIGNARKYADEVRKWLIRESKDVDELKVFNDAATMAGI